MRVNDLILQRRKQKGWSQQDLADRSGVSLSTIRRYERGEVHLPNPATVESIRKALDIEEPLKDLIYGETPTKAQQEKMLTLALSKGGKLYSYMSMPYRWTDPSIKYNGVVLLEDAFGFKKDDIAVLADIVESVGDYVWCNDKVYKVIKPGIRCLVETSDGQQTLLPQGEPYGIIKFTLNRV